VDNSSAIEGIKLEDYRQTVPSPIPGGSGWLLLDPQLTECESGLVEFAPGSPVAKLGLSVLDVSGAGCKR
jgi:hypothetical protein